MISTGLVIAVFGAVLAALVAGLGSAKAVGMVGAAAAGVVAEEPSQFRKVVFLSSAFSAAVLLNLQ